MPALEIPSPATTSRSRRLFSTTSAGALGLATLALLTACSSGSSSTTTAAGPGSPAAAASGAAGAGGRQGGPAASGLIAAADGSTLQVQSQQDGQVAVTWAASTTFTQQVTIAADTITAGECVTAVDPTGTASSASLTATTIQVTPAVDGSCTGGFGGGTGTRPSGAPSGGAAPSGAPTGAAMPSGAPTRTGTVASGSVVSVTGSTIVVAARQFGAGATTSPTAGSTRTTVNETVTIASTTTITAQQTATSAAATVGRCATAQGTADSTGAVAATSISITDAVDGACTGGFGGSGGGPNGGAPTASATTHD